MVVICAVVDNKYRRLTAKIDKKQFQFNTFVFAVGKGDVEKLPLSISLRFSEVFCFFFYFFRFDSNSYRVSRIQCVCFAIVESTIQIIPNEQTNKPKATNVRTQKNSREGQRNCNNVSTKVLIDLHTISTQRTVTCGLNKCLHIRFD